MEWAGFLLPFRLGTFRRDTNKAAADDDDGYCEASLQPRVEARPDRPQPARYRLLQTVDAADDLGALPQGRGDLLADQPQAFGSACRRDRRGGTAGAARSCAHA